MFPTVAPGTILPRKWACWAETAADDSCLSREILGRGYSSLQPVHRRVIPARTTVGAGEASAGHPRDPAPAHSTPELGVRESDLQHHITDAMVPSYASQVDLMRTMYHESGFSHKRFVVNTVQGYPQRHLPPANGARHWTCCPPSLKRIPRSSYEDAGPASDDAKGAWMKRLQAAVEGRVGVGM
ncbi:sex pilus assembly protein [Marssonina coronariae]|uniref:Sex pilus assembly protein n=1 Tax=Diplocarpon coronariae TaxID=2795749 RepID=A0A218ZBQ9_9HELO|nr:sex pilus assembly protein [Marssonina coronariae]